VRGGGGGEGRERAEVEGAAGKSANQCGVCTQEDGKRDGVVEGWGGGDEPPVYVVCEGVLSDVVCFVIGGAPTLCTLIGASMCTQLCLSRMRAANTR